MSMERWNPFWEMDMMRNRFDRMFEDRFPSLFDYGQQNQVMNLAVDVREAGNGYEIEAALPGFKSDDIDIEVDRDTVTIRGKMQSNNETRREGQNYIYRERRAGSFYRTIRLPGMLDGEKAEANLDHGILRISVPKMQETRSRRLKISPAQDRESGMFSDAARQSNTMMSGQGQSSSSSMMHGGTIGTTGSAMGMSGHSSTPTDTGTSSPIYDQSGRPLGTGTSSMSSEGDSGQPQSGAGQYGAGQTSGNLSQSQSMGNQ